MAQAPSPTFSTRLQLLSASLEQFATHFYGSIYTDLTFEGEVGQEGEG